MRLCNNRPNRDPSKFQLEAKYDNSILLETPAQQLECCCLEPTASISTSTESVNLSAKLRAEFSGSFVR